MLVNGAKSVDEDAAKKLKEALDWINGYLDKTGYIAGTKHITIADLVFFVWVSSLISLKKHLVNTDEYPKLLDWAKRIRSTLPNGAKTSDEGVKMLMKFFEEKTGLTL